MNHPRLGCVKYLNARPLIHGWPGEITFDHPAALCAQLAHGDLDVALVSSFEFLRNPIYRIVDGISISSDGPVYSVIVAYRDEIADLEQIEIDPASQTSANLLRCLVAELRNTDLQSVRPAEFYSSEHAPEQSSTGRTGDTPVFRCRLLIGDQAIRFRQEHADEFQFWDLGEAWKQLIDIPFVYALWLIRPEVTNPKLIANRLRALRDENLANLDRLIGSVVAGGVDTGGSQQFDASFCARYFRNHIRFDFGEREKEGLAAFARLCAKHGLLPKRELPFELV